jgi:hypothetical protein
MQRIILLPPAKGKRSVSAGQAIDKTGFSTDPKLLELVSAS